MLDIRSAARIVDVALQHGRQKQWKPLTVAVLDAGGSLMALMRDDGATFLRPKIAQAKAWGALGLGMGGASFGRTRCISSGLHVSDGRAMRWTDDSCTGRRSRAGSNPVYSGSRGNQRRQSGS